MACLETSFLIDVLQANEAAREVIEDLDDSGVRPSVALEYDEMLVTHDTDFERVPDLRVRTY